MALGFGEITPAGHIEFGCPDLVGLVGDKAPRPTQSQSRARAHTHPHAHTRIYTPRASASLALPPVRPAAQLASTCRGDCHLLRSWRQWVRPGGRTSRRICEAKPVDRMQRARLTQRWDRLLHLETDLRNPRTPHAETAHKPLALHCPHRTAWPIAQKNLRCDLESDRGPPCVRWQLCIWRCAVQIAYKALHVISMSRLYGFVSGNVPNELHGTSASHVLGMTALRCIASWIMSARPLPLAPTLLPQVRAHQPVRRVCRHQGALLVSEEQPCSQAPHP